MSRRPPKTGLRFFAPDVSRAPRPQPTRQQEPPGTQFLWGRHAVVAALGNPERRLHRFLATAEAAGDPALVGIAARPLIVEREQIDRLLPEGAAHQGLAVLVDRLKPVALEAVLERCAERERAVLVLLDQVSDPHNVGAVMRSAAAFGAEAVIAPDRHAPDRTGTLAKSASGAIEHVPLVRVVNLVRAIEQLKKAGFWTVGLSSDATRTLASQSLGGKVALVLGSEGDGLRRLTREACDLMAKLPTSGPVASLNVSNAAAIALYEMARN